MPSAKIDGRGWKSCQAMLPRAGPLPRALDKELLLSCACLCRGSGPRQRVFAECPSIFPRQILRPSAKMLCPVVAEVSFTYLKKAFNWSHLLGHLLHPQPAVGLSMP